MLWFQHINPKWWTSLFFLVMSIRYTYSSLLLPILQKKHTHQAPQWSCFFFETVKAQTVPVVNLDPHCFGRWKLDPILKGNQKKKQKTMLLGKCLYFLGGRGGAGFWFAFWWFLLVSLLFFLRIKFPLLTQLPATPNLWWPFFWRELLGAKTLRAKVKLGTSLRKKVQQKQISRRKKQGSSPSNCWWSNRLFTLLK